MNYNDIIGHVPQKLVTKSLQSYFTLSARGVPNSGVLNIQMPFVYIRIFFETAISAFRFFTE